MEALALNRAPLISGPVGQVKNVENAENVEYAEKDVKLLNSERSCLLN